MGPFLRAARALEAEGADGIATSCGFLALFQEELAARLSVPVATSSLLQIPLIERLLPARPTGRYHHGQRRVTDGGAS